MDATRQPPDRRRSDRRRTCFGGTLRLAAFLPELACRLRDLSLTGARVVVDETASLPRVVELTVPCRGETRRAVVVWRSGTEAGLAFLDDRPPDAGPETAARARALAQAPAQAPAQALAAWRAAVAPDRLH